MAENIKKALVLASGGVDSSTCLALAVERFGAKNVVALSLYYGQKHSRELAAARAVAEYLGVEYLELDMTAVFQYSNCSLLVQSDEEIPTGSYAEQQESSDGEPVATYVPFRNGVFIAAAASVALAKGCGVVYYGAHSDDAAGSAYPDCSEKFNAAMAAAVAEGSGCGLQLVAPFVSNTKAEVVAEGLRLGVPYHLTWSCYQGGERPCGVCGTCIDRLEAFRKNGVSDPLAYPDCDGK